MILLTDFAYGLQYLDLSQTDQKQVIQEDWA